MPDYHLRVRGPDHEFTARVDLDCEDTAEALKAALSVVSPYGHDLFAGDQFIARFHAGWGEHLEAEDLDG